MFCLQQITTTVSFLWNLWHEIDSKFTLHVKTNCRNVGFEIYFAFKTNFRNVSFVQKVIQYLVETIFLKNLGHFT